MGYNTTVVVMNDSLHAIEKDKEFGAKLVAAVLEAVHGKRVDVSAGGLETGLHCNAATVIESHHADTMVPVLIGANSGRELVGGAVGWSHDHQQQERLMLEQLADLHGYRLVKKSKRAKKG